jgi:membrane-bound metal-dependent hydrolase YbcI (DUF457 family)
MPHAIFHILIAIFIADFIRIYIVKDKKKFPFHYVFIAGIAGVLPDVDVIVFWVLYFFNFSLEEVHRTFTHTLLFPLIAIICAGATWNLKDKTVGKRHMRWHIIFLMIALGLIIHLVLDATVEGKIVPLYPFSNFSIGLNLVSYLPFALRGLLEPSLDAGIFILWLFWLEYKHKISYFI